jgi:hypothetical protein
MSDGSATIEAMARWLRDGGDITAAELVEQCDLEAHFVDIYFELGGERDYELFDVVIAAPRRVHKAVEEDSKLNELIESALRGCAQADGVYVRTINWVPRTATASQDKDRELSTMLTSFDADHVARFWQKCLDRKTRDPDGAITAARSMLESVCKHVLTERTVKFDPAANLPNLFNATLDSLSLAPRQQTDRTFRQLLGNCQAIVNGLAAIRNDIGDAHGKSITDEPADSVHAELAVNVAVSVGLFILHKSKCDVSIVTPSTL